MYGFMRMKDINTVRTQMLLKMIGDEDKLTTTSKVDLSRLPPCKNSLVPHIQRVNHRVCLYKQAHIAHIEAPNPYDEGQGWVRTGDKMEPLWSFGPIMPLSLIDLLLDNVDEEVEDVQQVDMEDIFMEDV